RQVGTSVRTDSNNLFRMYSVYLIENEKGKIYIGCTAGLEKRLESHNRPAGPDWTQGKGPWKLIHKEPFPSESEALKRESHLKSLKAGQRIKKILSISVGNDQR
ncbi:MAG TPA: GIY-YIG nuclease family protein, partial [Candidatus Gracilibacteria bacterium]